MQSLPQIPHFLLKKSTNNRSNPTNACACMCVYVAVLGAVAGGCARAKPRALTPTRPRVRVPALSVLAPGCVRRRWCSRTPSVNRARAPRAPTKCTGIFPEFFFPCADGLSRSRSRPLSLPVRVPGKKLTDRRRWPTVIQNEVLILTRDIMFLQRYRPKSACYWCLSSCD